VISKLKGNPAVVPIVFLRRAAIVFTDGKLYSEDEVGQAGMMISFLWMGVDHKFCLTASPAISGQLTGRAAPILSNSNYVERLETVLQFEKMKCEGRQDVADYVAHHEVASPIENGSALTLEPRSIVMVEKDVPLPATAHKIKQSPHLLMATMLLDGRVVALWLTAVLVTKASAGHRQQFGM
jgi:hypothetical protein